MTSVRNYRSMIERLQSSLPSSFSLEKVGEFKTNLRDYPFYKIILGRGNRKRILISASIHGDEPAGVETIIQLLSNNNFQSDDWEITLLPCLNPYGYEINSRENFHSQDLNRLFKESVANITPSSNVLHCFFTTISFPGIFNFMSTNLM